MSVLVVWENVPEEVVFYKLTSQETIELARKAHGQFINSTEEQDAAIELCEVLGHDDSVEKLDASRPLEGRFDEVIHVGFLL